MKRVKLFWIKQRYNPQLGTYYVCEGQLSKTAAKKMEGSIYGSNRMLSYANETAYLEAIQNLKKEGASIL